MVQPMPIAFIRCRLWGDASFRWATDQRKLAIGISRFTSLHVRAREPGNSDRQFALVRRPSERCIAPKSAANESNGHRLDHSAPERRIGGKRQGTRSNDGS